VEKRKENRKKWSDSQQSLIKIVFYVIRDCVLCTITFQAFNQNPPKTFSGFLPTKIHHPCSTLNK